MKNAYHRLGPLASAALFLLALTATATSTARAEVRDAADFFSDQAERQAEERIQRIRQQSGKDVVVETVPSMPGVPPASQAKERDDFFAREVARRGKEAGVDGVYLLVSREPTYLYVGVDPRTKEDTFSLNDRAAVREQLLSSFKSRDFDGGLLAALDAIDQRLAAKEGGGAAGAAVPPAGATGAGAPAKGAPAKGAPAKGAPAKATPRSESGGGGLLGMGGMTGWICLGVGALAIFLLVRGMMGRRQAAQGHPGFGQPGFGQGPGPGQPGYDPRYPQQQQGGMMGGGGGMGRGILGGLLGGMAGGYLYDQMRGPGGGGNEAQAAPPPGPRAPPPGKPHTSFGGGDFGGGDVGGGDFGGGDFGGGDFGGGE
jgi:hypothetical protein